MNSRLRIPAAILAGFLSVGCGGKGNDRPVLPGSIEVSSTPSGAAISLDGVDAGARTPATLNNVTAGSHLVRLALAGWADVIVRTFVSGGATSHVSAAFTTAIGTIVVSSNHPGTIIVDGQPTNTSTPDTLENVAVGIHTISVTTADCRWTGEVTVPQGGIASAEATVYRLTQSIDLRWGGTISANSSLAFGIGVDAMTREIFVGGYDTVEAISPDGGTLLHSWVDPDGVRGVAAGPDGNVYVVGWDSVQVYQPDGTLIQGWGGRGNAPGEFYFINSVGSIALDPQGSVYVVDNGNRRIQKFTTIGQFVTEWPIHTDANIFVTADSAGNVYACGPGFNVIEKRDGNGTLLGTFSFPSGSLAGCLPMFIDSPQSFFSVHTFPALGPYDPYYTVVAVKYTWDGKETLRFLMSEYGVNHLDAAWGIAPDGNGGFLICGRSESDFGRILRFAP